MDLREVRYIRHKRNTIHRVDILGNPIEMRLTFEQWWEIWEASGKYNLYGKGKGKYCMSRYNDIGHYEVGNVFIQLHSANAGQAHKGKVVSDKTRQKLSNAHAGRKIPPELVAKRTAAKIAKGTTGKGRPRTTESKQKQSEAMKGRKLSPETVAKRSATIRANTEKRRQENK